MMLVEKNAICVFSNAIASTKNRVAPLSPCATPKSAYCRNASFVLSAKLLLLQEPVLLYSSTEMYA